MIARGRSTDRRIPLTAGMPVPRAACFGGGGDNDDKKLGAARRGRGRSRY